MKKFLLVVLLSWLIYFSLWCVVYGLRLNKLAVQSEDTVPALFLPVALINNGSIYLDDFYNTMLSHYPNPDDKSYTKGLLPFYLRKAGDHYVSAFTIVTPLLVTPIYAVAAGMHIPFNWENLIIISHLGAAFIVALSGGFLYLLLKNKIKLSENKSILLTSVYLFATVNFAMISQSLWQHGSLELFVILGLYFLFTWKETSNYKNLFFFGLFAGLAILSRPTAGLFLVVYSAYYFFKSPKTAIPIILGMLPVLGFFFWYNNTFYQSISNQGYSNQLFRNWLGDFPISFFGVWLSPSKGILIYSPVFIFSILGFFQAWKTKKESDIYVLAGLIVFLHTLVISFWKHWFGGWSFGYRMSSDVIPFLVLLLVPFVQSHLFIKYKLAFTISIILSVFVELAGLIFFDGIWHAAYDRGFKDTSWLWSIRDSEFAFNIRRILVKVGVLSKACPTCLPGN